MDDSISVRALRLRRVRVPLLTPYRLSYRTFKAFEPIVVEVIDDQGRVGFGEGHISPGSSQETRAGGWAFATQLAKVLPGQHPGAARELIESRMEESPVAATSLISAIEMLEASPWLQIEERVRLPLLAPVNGTQPAEIETEIEHKLRAGFRTFKVKVGRAVDADLRRLESIQRAVDGRARLRVDANRAYDLADAIRFATELAPEGIELFEQPCAAQRWDVNAEVAGRSKVPIMLDEPICSLRDIDRASQIAGVEFCKLKLKRFGGLRLLVRALERVREKAMRPVLGDGLGCEITCWMEACVARGTIDNAGEFNGYLKPRSRLFSEPLGFENGALTMPAGYWPALNEEVVSSHTIECVHFGDW